MYDLILFSTASQNIEEKDWEWGYKPLDLLQEKMGVMYHQMIKYIVL